MHKGEAVTDPNCPKCADMTTKRDRAAAAAFFNDQPEWDLTIEALDAATAEEAALDNYSKPVGWSCSRTGVTWSSPRHHTEECWGDLPCLSPLVPVYLPLLVPKKTTWGASGGDEAVCCEYLECIGGHGGGGVLDYSLGSDVWRERAVSVYDSGEILIHEPPDVRGLYFAYSPCDDVASAIRFVVGRARK
jgi:hypothetical protein